MPTSPLRHDTTDEMNIKIESLNIKDKQEDYAQQQTIQHRDDSTPKLQKYNSSGSIDSVSSSPHNSEFKRESDMNKDYMSHLSGNGTNDVRGKSVFQPGMEFFPANMNQGPPQPRPHSNSDLYGIQDNISSSTYEQALSYRQMVYDQPPPVPLQAKTRDGLQQVPSKYMALHHEDHVAKAAMRRYLPQHSPYEFAQPQKFAGSHSNHHSYQQPSHQSNPPYNRSPQVGAYQQSHQNYVQSRGAPGPVAGGQPRHLQPTQHRGGPGMLFANQFPFIYVVNFKRTKDQFIHSKSYGRAFKKGDFVKVEADRGHDVGIISEIVLLPSHFMTDRTTVGEVEAELQVPIPQRCVITHASERDIEILLAKVRDEAHALQVCRQLAQQRQMRLNLLDAEFQFDKNKLTFIFTSDRHIDFRELVRDLFAIFKTRIWMHKINPFQASMFTASLNSEPFQGAIQERQYRDQQVNQNQHNQHQYMPQHQEIHHPAYHERTDSRVSPHNVQYPPSHLSTGEHTESQQSAHDEILSNSQGHQHHDLLERYLPRRYSGNYEESDKNSSQYDPYADTQHSLSNSTTES